MSDSEDEVFNPYRKKTLEKSMVNPDGSLQINPKIRSHWTRTAAARAARRRGEAAPSQPSSQGASSQGAPSQPDLSTIGFSQVGQRPDNFSLDDPAPAQSSTASQGAVPAPTGPVRSPVTAAAPVRAPVSQSNEDPTALYRGYVHSHEASQANAAPERDFVSSDQLNQAAAQHGGEVFDPAANQQAAHAAASLPAEPAPASDPSALYRGYVHSHEGTGVSCAPGREASSEQLNAAAAAHGGEVFVYSESSTEEQARVCLSPEENSEALAAMPCQDKVDMYGCMTPEQRARMLVQMSPEDKERLISGLTPEQRQAQASYNRSTFNQQVLGLREYQGGSQKVLTPKELHCSIMHQGLTLAPEKEAEVLLSLEQDPVNAIIVMCGLPIAPAQTVRLLRNLILPNLSISTQTKMELSREIVVTATAADVDGLRDRLLAAVRAASVV